MLLEELVRRGHVDRVPLRDRIAKGQGADGLSATNHELPGRRDEELKTPRQRLSTDIFLSYAHQDLERARSIAEALTTEGWSVFWDRRIPPGRVFEGYLEQRVRESRVMVVLWSPHAVASKWVKIEAAIGRDRDILVPVLIAKAAIPFGYGHLHAADLTDWRPGAGSLEFEELVSSIDGLAPRTHRTER